MLFLTFLENVGEYPNHIFKGFEKINLNPGKSKSVTIEVNDHALSYFNVDKNSYIRVNNGIIKFFFAENGDLSQVKLTKEIVAKK